MSVDESGKADNVIQIGDATKDRRPARTIEANKRRYDPSRCPHKGPYIVDRQLANVECGECGAHLNPIFVLEILAARESYWNERMRDLGQYLADVEKQIEGRTRTKCTHCGNMTAIKFEKEMPRTWYHHPG